MNTTLIVPVIALIVLCIVLMLKIIKQEYVIYDLNDKLNLSDGEYVDLFNVNLGLSEQVENFAKTRISETWYSEELEKRMNIIGQNGNDGTHYEKQLQKPIIPEIGTKEFNDLCSEMFGGKPKK